ncbi:polysaccharide deacetylase [Anaerobacillus alkaliphilus]|uniref:Polysaccharide deacetylase n=1 Tax=Anaerobacillus alkaliphilus TaxID=1548597 RepID=A0A4Q0VQT5_9BACI|nr:polysaccharide deacetylase family protein [Anaerobacillus alkaliphilus]RXI98608.1 polysaccharide deacetylase [Anaerobacillus alkaliphilus]
MKYLIPLILLMIHFSLITFQALDTYAREHNEKKEYVFDRNPVQFSETIGTKYMFKKEISSEKSIRFVTKEIEGIVINEPPVVKRSFFAGPTYFGNVSDEKIAFLTFDDGPSKNTEIILDLLKIEGIKATFFVNGKRGDYEKSLYKRIVDEGHAIGNHTYSHDYSIIYKSKEAFLEDFRKLESLLIETIGFAPKLMRFPGGSNNSISQRYGGKDIMNEIVGMMTELGYLHTDWNVDSQDSLSNNRSKKEIIEQVVDSTNGKNELVILFHDSKPKTTTPEALVEIIEDLRNQNFRFEIMDENSFFTQFLSAKK